MCDSSITNIIVKSPPTGKTSKIIYRNRSCAKCIKAPCFLGFENMKTDFAMAGCIEYKAKC